MKEGFRWQFPLVKFGDLQPISNFLEPLYGDWSMKGIDVTGLWDVWNVFALLDIKVKESFGEVAEPVI